MMSGCLVDNNNLNLFNGEAIFDWFCTKCNEYHKMTSRRKLQPFAKKHGFFFESIDDDGDCFYSTIVRCFPSCSVSDLRELVALHLSNEHLEFYKSLVDVELEEYNWIHELNNNGVFESIECLRDYVRICGSENDGNCFWADEFAINIVGQCIQVNILFIDFDSGMCNPYRKLYECSEDCYIIILRKDNHYQPLVYEDNCVWNRETLPPVVLSLWKI